MPGTFRGQGAERLDDEDEQDRLGRAEVGLDRGFVSGQKDGVPDGLDEVIGQEQKENVEGQEKGLGRLSGHDDREKAEEPFA